MNPTNSTPNTSSNPPTNTASHSMSHAGAITEWGPELSRRSHGNELDWETTLAERPDDN